MLITETSGRLVDLKAALGQWPPRADVAELVDALDLGSDKPATFNSKNNILEKTRILVCPNLCPTMTDEIIRQGEGFTIYRTTDWGPAIPYRPAERETSTNHGFVDLRSQPDLVADIAEAQASPGLQDILRALNEPTSPLMSLGCERRLNERPSQQGGFGWYYHSYTDLTFRDPQEHAHERQLVDLADRLLQNVESSPTAVFGFELGVQRMRRFFGREEGYCLSMGLSAYGSTPEEAEGSYEVAAHLVASAFRRMR